MVHGVGSKSVLVPGYELPEGLCVLGTVVVHPEPKGERDGRKHYEQNLDLPTPVARLGTTSDYAQVLGADCCADSDADDERPNQDELHECSLVEDDEQMVYAENKEPEKEQTKPFPERDSRRRATGFDASRLH
jgi:hypothetical protein